jgi:hypothetical protein
MKSYHCICGQLIFFENVVCTNCGRSLGYLPDLRVMSSLEPVENKIGSYIASGPDASKQEYRTSVCRAA